VPNGFLKANFFSPICNCGRRQVEWRWLSQEALATEVKTARGLFQRGLLAFLRNVEAEQGLQRMRDALAAIERVARRKPRKPFGGRVSASSTV